MWAMRRSQPNRLLVLDVEMWQSKRPTWIVSAGIDCPSLSCAVLMLSASFMPITEKGRDSMICKQDGVSQSHLVFYQWNRLGASQNSSRGFRS